MDEFKNEGQRPRLKCRVALVLEVLEDGDADDLRTALKDPVITAAAIMRVLERKGHRLPDATITRHRRRECGCD